MTAAAENIQRDRFHGRDLLKIAHPVNATSHIYANTIVAREAGTNVVIPAANTAGLRVCGVSLEEVDNTSGADGTYGPPAARLVTVDADGIWPFAVDGATPKFDQIAYVVDDNTVSAAVTTNGVIAGRFVRPNPQVSGEWFVDFSKRDGVGGVSTDLADLTENAGAIGGTNDGDLPVLTVTATAPGTGADGTTPAGAQWAAAVADITDLVAGVRELAARINSIQAVLRAAGLMA